MKISLIITTYNRPKMLKRVLESLRYQTRQADEVFIADDGSGNETCEVISSFKESFNGKVFHVWQEDMGFRAAKIRNKAIRESTGDYIIVLDGDCIPSKHFVKDHLLLAREGFFFQGKRILISQRLSESFSFQDTNSMWKLIRYFLTHHISNGHHLFRLPLFPSYYSGKLNGIRSCNMGFFRKDIIAVNGFNEAFVGWGREDSELVARFFKYGLMKRIHPFMAICFHLWHEENDRRSLEKNDDYLKKAIASNEYICADGLEQKGITSR